MTSITTLARHHAEGQAAPTGRTQEDPLTRIKIMVDFPEGTICPLGLTRNEPTRDPLLDPAS